MSAHFIPFTEHTEDGEDAWFCGFLGYWAGIQAWRILAGYVRFDEELYQAVEDTKGWVSPETIKEFAEKISELDVTTMELPLLSDCGPLYTTEEHYEALRICLKRLKEVILDCAEKGRGILHFH